MTHVCYKSRCFRFGYIHKYNVIYMQINYELIHIYDTNLCNIENIRCESIQLPYDECKDITIKRLVESKGSIQELEEPIVCRDFYQFKFGVEQHNNQKFLTKLHRSGPAVIKLTEQGSIHFTMIIDKLTLLNLCLSNMVYKEVIEIIVVLILDIELSEVSNWKTTQIDYHFNTPLRTGGKIKFIPH